MRRGNAPTWLLPLWISPTSCATSSRAIRTPTSCPMEGTSMASLLRGLFENGLAYRADTLDELADQIDIPASALKNCGGVQRRLRRWRTG